LFFDNQLITNPTTLRLGSAWSAAAAHQAPPGQAHGNGSITQAVGIEHTDRFAGISTGGHCDQRLACRQTGLAIFEHRDQGDLARLRKQLTQIIIRGCIR
jgi:hypothetical protein